MHTKAEQYLHDTTCNLSHYSDDVLDTQSHIVYKFDDRSRLMLDKQDGSRVVYNHRGHVLGNKE